LLIAQPLWQTNVLIVSLQRNLCYSRLSLISDCDATINL